jgi:myo-inositol-1(or 4)-monophosphatase
MSRSTDLTRIEEALAAAAEILQRFTPGRVAVETKSGGSPVTEADRVVNEALRSLLPRDGEGWLSEETTDEPSRLERRRVWVVDPLDGTREFVMGLPEWCVSIGLLEDGEPVAGGICNPATGQTMLGARGSGVTLNSDRVSMSTCRDLRQATVLASRSEVERGEWKRFDAAPFEVRALGSVAYKLGLVAAGLAEATWTLVPKHEWDVAAGVALVKAGGGDVRTSKGMPVELNQRTPLLPGLVATCPGLAAEVGAVLDLA